MKTENQRNKRRIRQGYEDLETGEKLSHGDSVANLRWCKAWKL